MYLCIKNMIDRFTSPIHFNRKFTKLKTKKSDMRVTRVTCSSTFRYLIEKHHINEIRNVNTCLMICLKNYDLKGKVT